MRGARHPLAGRHRWVSALSTVAVVIGLLLALVYASVAIDFPPGSRLGLAIVLVVVGGGLNFLGDGVEQRRLMSLRMVGDGTIPPTRANLLSAARAVASLPELSFWLCLGFLCVGSLVVCLICAALVELPVQALLRMGFIGLAIAPITATLSLLVTLPRARRVLTEIVAAGLPASELHAGLTQRFVLQQRLMVFAVFASVSPAAFLIDLSYARLKDVVAATSAEALAAHRVQGLPGIVGLVCLCVIIVGVSAWLSGSSLGEPLKHLALETERLSKGQHGEPRFIAAEYESLAASGALAGIEAQLLVVLEPLGQAATSLSASTSTLSPATTSARHRPALEAANETTHGVARSAREVALNAESVSRFARETLEAAQRGQRASTGFLEAMAEVRRGNQAIADSVVRLNKRVQQVGRIVEFIEGIADRSDLLALNAELEGHKAGEVGQGFSLVAAEMRRLSEAVMGSTREIGRLIEEIRDATNAAVMATEAGVKATDVGAALAHKVGDGLQRIVEFANQSADAMAGISLATAQQRLGTDQLVNAMGAILQSAEESAHANREMTEAHAQLVALATQLARTIAAFEVAR